MNGQYTHRNGETEPPTIKGVWFWFMSDGDADISAMGMLFIYPQGDDVAGTFDDVDGDTTCISELEGRWWGPVTPPWEQNS